jgi:predicted RNase H-like HicB family nuclease
MARYVIVIERAEHNYSAYAPDVPGCGATGATIEEVTRELRDALAFHFEGLQADGEPVPPPVATDAAFVEVDIPAPSPPSSPI